jgi:signal transduction histidine kinase
MKLDLRALGKDGAKGGLIGSGISAAVVLINQGFPHSVFAWPSIIGFGLGIGFLLTVGNKLVGTVIQHLFPRLKGWPLLNAGLAFPVSVPLFYLTFSLIYPWSPFHQRLACSFGAGIAAVMVAFYFFYTEEKEEIIRLKQENQKLLVLQERNRIAREFHDSVSQNLFAISLHLSTLECLHTQDPEAFRKKAQQLRQMVIETQEEMGLLIYELRPIIGEQGFYEALESLCVLYSIRYKLRITNVFNGNEENLNSNVQTGLYRVAQEALNNIIKHAKACAVQLEIEVSPQGKGIMRIRDDGRGFDPHEDYGEGCFGLPGMRERVAEIGGKLTIDSSRGKGTTVTVIF